MKRTYVYTTFQQEGYHCFPEAATDSTFATGDYLDVSHLSVRHFHYFYFKVWVEVNHHNRDIEFIQLRRWIQLQYESKSLEMNSKSCEMLADELIEILREKYPGVGIKVDVSEENINGAIVEYAP